MNLEVLNYAIQNGILDLSCVEQLIKTNERKKYLTSHPYKLYLGGDGLWTTYLPDPSKVGERIAVAESIGTNAIDGSFIFWTSFAINTAPIVK